MMLFKTVFLPLLLWPVLAAGDGWLGVFLADSESEARIAEVAQRGEQHVAGHPAEGFDEERGHFEDRSTPRFGCRSRALSGAGDDEHAHGARAEGAQRSRALARCRSRREHVIDDPHIPPLEPAPGAPRPPDPKRAAHVGRA